MPIRDLKDLLTSPDGVHFLASQDIFVAPEDFVTRLQAPVQAGLTEHLGIESQKPVYALQQVYVDCTQSMLDRMALLDCFEPHEDCFPFFLWIDTDLAKTDALMLRFVWPLFGKKVSVRLSAGAHDNLELRFVPIEMPRVLQALDKLDVYLSQSITGRKKVTRAKAKDRYEQLKAVFLQQTSGVLSQLNHRVAYFLLQNQAGLNPFSVLVSDLIGRDLMTAEINLFLNHLDEAIRVFNDAVQALEAQGIAPQVKPLAVDYLPLHFSCLGCQRRLRLSRETQGNDQFAVASCKCQRQYRFHLGSHRLSIDDIVHAGPWSPDVSLTLFMNDFVSGYIGGGSSGIYYGLVMKQVLEKVLHKRRVPILLPQPIGVAGNDPEPVDSLLYRYLMDLTG
ncbi:MAG: hypothetical protein V3S24_23010 [Candidatus Tectomicrobia bacterium]